MQLLGYPRSGGTPVTLAVNKKWVSRFLSISAIRLAKLSVYLDGQGGGDTAQTVRAVVYGSRDDGDDLLLAQSDPVTIAPGSDPAWIDFELAAGGVSVRPGTTVSIGVQGGPTGGTIRLFRGGDGETVEITDSYADGPADALGTGSETADNLCVFAPYFTHWTPPSEIDAYYARLPFPEAQLVLGSTAPLPGDRTVVCGWHFTRFDPEWGSFAIVQTGGELADMLGERIGVSVRHGTKVRSVVAYVHREATLPNPADALSLPRRLFANLDRLALKNRLVNVAVLGTTPAGVDFQGGDEFELYDTHLFDSLPDSDPTYG